ncbi:uncharacterized protein LOC129720614 [Wyeomyia smithii]|uniref:uncharacterized protein LOC129720614 n=1 Tax=Wyeomyia smithii TaxID=174621 RepID=UPI002467E5EE|nr:uncharacterized protein LOC129720614 [Wyeomyia smithii]
MIIATSNLRRGGGTLIAVKSSITSTLIQLEDSGPLEQIAVKLSLPTKSVFFCGIYLRPNSDPSNYAAHSNCVQQIITKATSGDSVIVVGDYNLPHLTWSYDNDVDSFVPTNASSEQELIFTENMIASGLQQICDVPNSHGRLLDLAFVSNSSEIELIGMPFTLLPCDQHHKPFVLRLPTSSSSENHSVNPVNQSLDINRCNFDAVISELRLQDWDGISHEAHTDTAVTTFYDVLFSIITRNTPIRTTRIRRVYNHPWWNATLRHKRNVLRKARRRFMRHRTAEYRVTLRMLETDYDECLHSAYRDYIFRIESEAKADPTVMSYEGTTTNDTDASVELFATFFKSVYNPIPTPVSPELLNSLPLYDVHLPRPTFTTAEVTTALKSIDPSKGPGPDKLPLAFIQRCAEVYRVISSLVDRAALPQDIDNIVFWSNLNGMEMNATKCIIISFTRTRTQQHYEYRVNGFNLERVSSIQDLGVTFNSKLCFNEHITATTCKAFALLGFIRRNARDFSDVYALKTLYCSIVRSVLEYAVQIWAPHQEAQIIRIERIQRVTNQITTYNMNDHTSSFLETFFDSTPPSSPSNSVFSFDSFDSNQMDTSDPLESSSIESLISCSTDTDIISEDDSMNDSLVSGTSITSIFSDCDKEISETDSDIVPNSKPCCCDGNFKVPVLSLEPSQNFCVTNRSDVSQQINNFNELGTNLLINKDLSVTDMPIDGDVKYWDKMLTCNRLMSYPAIDTKTQKEPTHSSLHDVNQNNSSVAKIKLEEKVVCDENQNSTEMIAVAFETPAITFKTNCISDQDQRNNQNPAENNADNRCTVINDVTTNCSEQEPYLNNFGIILPTDSKDVLHKPITHCDAVYDSEIYTQKIVQNHSRSVIPRLDFEHLKKQAPLSERSKELISSIIAVLKRLKKMELKGDKLFLRVKSKATWDDCFFENDILTRKPEENTMKTIRFDSKQGKHRFKLVMFLLSEIFKLLATQSSCTKRELYYRDPNLTGNQTKMEEGLRDVCFLLNADPWELNIFASSKGLVAGPLQFRSRNDETVDCFNSLGTLIPGDVHGSMEISVNADMLLIVEKDTVFRRLLDDGILVRLLKRVVLITSKGYPDVGTRLLLKKIWNLYQMPMYALVDADPYGIEIYCVYKFGSLALSHQSHSLAVPTIQWLGVRPSHITLLQLKKLPLTDRDRARTTELLKRPYIGQPGCELERELKLLQQENGKAEIESLADLSIDYLVSTYLPNQLAMFTQGHKD